MKNKYTLLLSLFFLVCNAQHKYLLEHEGDLLTSSVQPVWDYSLSYMELGNEVSFFSVGLNAGNQSNFDTNVIFTTSTELSEITCKINSFSGTLTGCISYTINSTAISSDCFEDSDFIMNTVSNNNCTSGSISKFKLIKLEDFTLINSYSITNNEILTCESKELMISSGCNQYALEYKFGINDWTDLLPYGPNSSSVEIQFSDFPGVSVNENIFIRLRYLDIAINDNAYSEILTYKFTSCSPQLLDFQEQDTSCSYTEDGSFSMILDRDLGANKKLVASLFYEFTPNTFSLLAQKDTTTLVDNGNGTFTYNWPTDTPILPGRYKVRYQTLDTSTPNPVWDSLEGTEDGFEIGNPPPVTFDGVVLNQVFCHDGNDATIRLEANGGVGNYEYQINSGSWQPFMDTSVNATQLINANAGSKNIKIKDGNGCTERN